MIARVAVAPGLIASLTPEETPDDLAELIDRHDRIIEALLQHGALVVSCREEWNELKRVLVALAHVAPDAKKRWEAALQSLTAKRRLVLIEPAASPELDTVAAVSDLDPGWCGRRVNIAALPTRQATMLGIPPTEVALKDPKSGITLAKGALVSRADPIPRFVKLATDGLIPVGEPRDRFWEQVLLPLVTEAKVISVVDRYLYNELVWRSKRRRAAAAEHLTWLLERIDATRGAHRKHVVLLGGVGEDGMPATVDEARDLIKAAWTPLDGRIEDLKIVGADWRAARRADPLAHDRHISFDLGVAIEISAGLSRLKQPKVEDDPGVAWSYRHSPTAFGKCRQERDKIVRVAQAAKLQF